MDSCYGWSDGTVRRNQPVGATMIVWDTLEGFVFDQPSKPDLFNPYRDRNPDFDRIGAAEIRRRNLRHYLDDHAGGASLLLVAEAPGPWGCRFSGIPVTSEAQLVDSSFPATGDQSKFTGGTFQ